MKRNPWSRVVFYIAIIITCVAVFFPAYWLFVTSLTKRTSLLVSAGLFPSLDSLTFDAYIKIFHGRPLAAWFANSVFISVGTIALVLIVTTLAAYSLSRFRSRANRAIGYSLLLVCMMPPTLIIIPLYVMFSSVGMINTPFGVILANTAITVPFSSWMMKSFFDGIPVSLEESAQIDGCGVLSSVGRVVLPLSLPGLATTVIYVAVLAWSDFLFARTFLMSEPNWTMTVGVYSMIGEHTIMWEELSAAGIISIIPISVMFLFFQKYLISGMALGAVKQ